MNFSKICFLRDRRVTYGRLHFLLRSVRSKHRTVDQKMKNLSGFLRSTPAYVFRRGYGVSTNCYNYRMVISQRHSTKTLTGLQNKTSYYRKQTNHWNCWVTWNNFWIEVKQDITHTIQQSISWLLVISRTALCRLDTTTNSSYPYLLKTKVSQASPHLNVYLASCIFPWRGKMFSSGVNWHSTTSATFFSGIIISLVSRLSSSCNCTFHILRICDDFQRHILVIRKDKDATFITNSVHT